MCASARDNNILLRRRCFRPCGRSSADTWNREPQRKRARSGLSSILFSTHRYFLRIRIMAQLAEKPTVAAAPRVGKQGDPCVMVIFGAAGDLTARMLIPALYNLARADLLSKEFAVLGVARK